MPAEGVQFSTKAKVEDEPPVKLLSQWRQQKSEKAAPKEPPLVGKANSDTGASNHASQ